MAKNPEHLTCLEVLDKSSEFLRMKGVPSPKCDSEWIISSVLEKKRLELYLKPDEILSEEAIGKIRAMVVMRGKRIPLQHILQSVNFAGILLKCDRRALIPRPETESLVDHVLGRVPKSFEGNILDLGIGSGAILIALCLSLEQASGIGLDSSEDALALAEENIITQGLEKRIHLRKFDWHVDDLSQIDANLIISNPPYLLAREWESAEPEVKVHDPPEALVSEQDGFADLGRIIGLGAQSLKSEGILALEFGAGHPEMIEDALSSDFGEIEILKDLSHRKRFAIARRK